MGNLLGFTRQILQANGTQQSDLPVTILKVNGQRVECNITTGLYINSKQDHTIHEFFPTVPPVPLSVIYLPVNDNISFANLNS